MSETIIEAASRIVMDEKKLSIVCEEVTHDNCLEAAGAKTDLLKTTKLFSKQHPSGCAGLAANQLGYNLRIFVIKTKKGWKIFENPTFLKAGPLMPKTEGCLSFPNKKIKVMRHTKIYAKSDGGKRHLLTGMEAQAFQHELDHLNGKLV